MDTRDVVQAFYDAAASGDLQTFLGLLADDAVIRGGMRTMFGQASAVLDVPTLKVRHMVVEGDRAFTVLSVDRNGGGGTMLIAEEAVIRDGKVAELRIYVHDAAGVVTAA
jgi:uncharacterized protein